MGLLYPYLMGCDTVRRRFEQSSFFHVQDQVIQGISGYLLGQRDPDNEVL